MLPKGHSGTHQTQAPCDCARSKRIDHQQSRCLGSHVLSLMGTNHLYSGPTHPRLWVRSSPRQRRNSATGRTAKSPRHRSFRVLDERCPPCHRQRSRARLGSTQATSHRSCPARPLGRDTRRQACRCGRSTRLLQRWHPHHA